MVTITDSAARKLKELMAEKGADGTEYRQETVGLRVFVQGGGCSGFQYGMQLENDPQEADLKFESNGIRVYIDHISLSYLKDSEVDLVDGPTGGFAIKNPNATSTCGCGQSFNTE